MIISEVTIPISQAPFVVAKPGTLFSNPTVIYSGLAPFVRNPAVHYVSGFQPTPNIASFELVPYSPNFQFGFALSQDPLPHIIAVNYLAKPFVWDAGLFFDVTTEVVGSSYVVPQREPAKAKVEYKPPKPMHFFPAPERLRTLYAQLGKEIATHFDRGVPEELQRAFSAALGKISRLTYERVSLELVGSESVFFNMKFPNGTTVHVEIYIEPLEEMSKDCYYSCYQEKQPIQTGQGSLDAILAELMRLTSPQVAQQKIA
jgi:hypothetical protein